MASQNEYTIRLDALNEQLVAAQTALADARAGLASQQARFDDWMRTYRGPGNSAEADAALADATMWIGTFSQRITDSTANIKAIQGSIEKAQLAYDEYNAALATAAREGLSGEAAEIRAQATVEQAKGMRNLLTYLGIGFLVVLVVVGVIWYRSRKR
jgi:multidrug resistance efflux pump